jgi:diguanylate cyclase (GGDEF)-like protein/PAS domain S-box-containing protein
MFDQNETFVYLLNNLADGVYFTDLEGRIIYWNKGAEQLSGYRESEVLGKMCRENILMHMDASGRVLCTSTCPLREAMQDGQPREADIYMHHKNGSRISIHLWTGPLRDSSGRIIGAVEAFSDNTAKTQMAEKLAQMEQLALLDPLTSLPNRRYLDSHIYSCLEEFRRGGWNFGILYMDVDDFKSINDRFGHEAGDLALKMVARTLDANSRYFDVVGRWGGEEFIAVIHHVNESSLTESAERLRMLVERSSLSDYGSLHVTISIGGAPAGAGDTAETVLNRADANLYKAKQSGKNCVCISGQTVSVL